MSRADLPALRQAERKRLLDAALDAVMQKTPPEDRLLVFADLVLGSGAVVVSGALTEDAFSDAVTDVAVRWNILDEGAGRRFAANLIRTAREGDTDATQRAFLVAYMVTIIPTLVPGSNGLPVASLTAGRYAAERGFDDSSAVAAVHDAVAALADLPEGSIERGAFLAVLPDVIAARLRRKAV